MNAAGAIFSLRHPLVAEVEALMEKAAGGYPGEPAGHILQEHLATGGKRLRARLALSCSAVLRGDSLPSADVPWAAACELLHNGTLIHDDIQDGDAQRRGAPTAWKTHGLAQALNGGDLALLLPFEVLGTCQVADGVKLALMEVLSRQGAQVIRGQAAEIQLKELQDTGRQAYLDAVRGKTSALFQLPVQGAALLSGMSGEAAASLGEVWSRLGVMFQIQDDILDLFGDKGRAETGTDLREGKISALVVTHLELHPNDRRELLTLLALSREQTQPADVELFTERFAQGGALAAAVALVKSGKDQMLAHPSLTEHLGLAGLAKTLLDQMVQPIAHVL